MRERLVNSRPYKNNRRTEATEEQLDWIRASGGTGFVCWVRVGKWWKKEVWPATGAALGELSSRYPGALIVMEAGCHSPRGQPASGARGM